MKIKIVLISFLLISFFANSLKAQDLPNSNSENNQAEDEDNYWSNSKEVGLNVTPLISKLVPFNIGDKSSGLIGIKTKFYGGGDYAFRLTFGADLGQEDAGFFHFGVGYERRRKLSNKFSYTSGWQTILEANNEGNSNTNVLAGVSKFYGLEYNINNTFFIGTESQLLMGIDFGNLSGVRLKFNAPIAIFAHVRIFNK